MNVTILGLWHLGSVTAACCSRHFEVVGLDFEEPVIAGLRGGQAPLLEPGLDALIQANASAGRLRFSADPVDACAGTEVLWVCYDTPVNDADESDAGFVLE